MHRWFLVTVVLDNMKFYCCCDEVFLALPEAFDYHFGLPLG